MSSLPTSIDAGPELDLPGRSLNLRGRFTPDGIRLDEDSACHGSDFFYEHKELCGRLTRRFELRVVKPTLDAVDVALFDQKTRDCLRRMAAIAPLRLWEFAVNLRSVNEAAPLFVVRLECLIRTIRRDRVDAYCYGAHPSSELGLALCRGRFEDWLLREAPAA